LAVFTWTCPFIVSIVPYITNDMNFSIFLEPCHEISSLDGNY
jgi:hypothetical protein